MSDEPIPITLLLVADQATVHEAVHQMLADEPDTHLHLCADPTAALDFADRLAPTVILQALVLRDVDGLMLVRFFRANPSTQQTPLIVLSAQEEPLVRTEAFAAGATDYLITMPDRIELLARIRYHSAGHLRLLERTQARTIVDFQRQELAKFVAAVARFVHSLLPLPLTGPIRTNWKDVPSEHLGGDAFGYDWLDADRFAFYLLEVTGQGVECALFAATILNALRTRSLPNTDFTDPGRVLGNLNTAFSMGEYGERFFTLWYGVFDRSTAMLRWSGGGHPDALLFEHESGPVYLSSTGPMLGMMPELAFDTEERSIAPGARLHLPCSRGSTLEVQF